MFNPSRCNYSGKLAVPIIVGFGAVWFTVRHNHDIELARAHHESDQSITLDNQRETVLQTHLDKMSDLILHLMFKLNGLSRTLLRVPARFGMDEQCY